MNFVFVPPDQKKVDVTITEWPGESDAGPFPSPTTLHRGLAGLLPALGRQSELGLEDLQRDRKNQGVTGTRLLFDPVNRMLYEFFGDEKDRVPAGKASQSVCIRPKTNRMRPNDWTSADAAGLPIFSAVVRYDELQRGIVEARPPRHRDEDPPGLCLSGNPPCQQKYRSNPARMGERIGLRNDFDISGFSPDCRRSSRGSKKYGMFVADNGIDWAISVAPDPRIPS